MAIFQSLKNLFDGIHTVLGPLADLTDLARLFENTSGAFKKLPQDVQAKIRRGDAFSQFRDAITKLDPKEKDAVRLILSRLRNDQAKQEYFILKAAAQGGLDTPQATVDFLKDLATMGTDEAIQYLEDVDATQPSSTIPKGATAAVANAANKAAAGINASVQSSGLDKIAEDLRNKAETWAKR